MIICTQCSVTKNSKDRKDGSPKLPGGWKRLKGAVYCKNCWRQRYMLRAVTLPIAGPVEGKWAELRAALNEAWAGSTQVANFSITELAKADFVRDASMEKMPPPPAVYLYPAVRALRPELAPVSVTSMIQTVSKCYRKKRKQVLWFGEASLPRYKFPMPYPVRAGDWDVHFDEHLRPYVSVRIGSVVWKLWLRGGHEFRRQLKVVRQLVAGEALPCELVLLRKRANLSDHRNGVTVRAAGGGRKTPTRVMVKLVAWIPRPVVQPGTHLLLLHTDKEHFWVAHTEEREQPWIINRDDIRKVIAARQWQRKRFSQDLKYEKRWPAQTRRRIVEASRLHSEKFQARINTFSDQVTAMLAQHAVRQRVSVVKYDDLVHDYFPEFPWYQLREKLRYKLDERGIKLEAVADTVGTEDSEALEGEDDD